MKNKNGITLIALVITIVVMLILAGISLVGIFGENGIINRARLAAFAQEMTEVQENVDLKKHDNAIAILTGEAENVKLFEYTLEERTDLNLPSTLIQEILYIRAGIPTDASPSDYDIGVFDKAGIWIVDEKQGKGKKDTYIYDSRSNVVFKINGITISGKTYHSYTTAMLRKCGESSKEIEKDTIISDEAQIVSVDGEKYYEPDLKGFSAGKTEIIYYSEDMSQQITKTAKEYIANGKKNIENIDGTTYQFHSYSNKKIWANIKTTGTGLESWWVWIPRYAYKINGTSEEEPISIIYVDINGNPLKEEYNGVLPEGYEVHPAFTTTDKELKGIWMSKYEPSFAEQIPSYGVLAPDMTGFDSNNTYIELYDETIQAFTEEVKLSEANLASINQDNKWYDYTKKQWANIKTVANNLESWWVWIPRYAYNRNADWNAARMDIIFVDLNNTPIDKVNFPNGLPEGYEVHPAFTTTDKELKGIWMSKYEPSYGEPQGMDEILEPDISGFDENNTYIEIYSIETQNFVQEIKLKDADISNVNQKTTKWYDYPNKIWANVKTTANGLESWWVWVPRYAYKIGSDSTSKSVSIIFLDTNDNPLNTTMYPNGIPNGYEVHPAFNVGDKKLKGLWMSKYEPSYAEPVGMNEVLSPDITGFDETCTYIEIYNTESEQFSEEILLENIDKNNLSSLNQETTKWYDYPNKIWANIKTIGQENNLESWWVWIPRYAYQIGSDSTYKSTSIIFIDTNDKPLNTTMYPNGLPAGYEVHPAFNVGDKKLKGLWMSKYEPSNSETN